MHEGKWIINGHDTERVGYFSLCVRSGSDCQQSSFVVRVKGVEDLNICIIGAQGIVGVGATTRMCT